MKRMCDKIVDCLDGEDEINCSSMRSTSSLTDSFVSTSKDSIFERKGNLDINKAENSSSEESSSNEESHKDQVETIHNAQSSDLKNNHKIESMVATIAQTNTTDTLPTQQTIEIEMSTTSTNTDFIKVSNMENSNRNSFQFNLTSSENIEDITVDPNRSATNDEENNNRGDIQSFIASVSKESLESRSSVLGNKEADIHEDLSDTLNMNSPTSFSTTTIESPTTHHGEALVHNASIQNTSNSNHEFNVSVRKPNQTAETNSSTHLSNLLENENIELESKDILIDLPEQSVTNNEDNSTESEAKHLFFPDKNGILDKIKDIIASQLQPAKQKIKHLIPNTFECQR